MSEPQLISRSQAREQSLLKYYTGKPCRKGHIAQRYLSTGQCQDCMGAQSKSWHKANPERSREKSLRYRAKNVDIQNQRTREWRTKVRAMATYRNRKLEGMSFAEANRIRALKWANDNPERRRAQRGIRKAYILDATYLPQQDDLELIGKIYENCPEGYHVDHIFPLKGKNCSGLHTPANLQYLPANDNIRKSNKVPNLETAPKPDWSHLRGAA